MRRILVILALIAGCGAGLAATATGDDTRTYFIEMDNAFGLVNGSEVKVAGVATGTIVDLDINSKKRAVLKVELSGPLAILGEETVCSSDPQSLIAEYFIDCAPQGDPIQEGTGSDAERAENPDIPVEQTRQTVQQDLVQNGLRQPFRERLTLLINEFGTALAGNPDELNEAIRRGAPALQETQEVFDLLASQSSTIRDLNVDSDRILTELANRRRDVTEWIDNTRVTAVASAERRDDLGRNFDLLDDFLAELRPTMVDLGALADEQTPLLANLRLAAPGLNTLSRNLPDFNAAGTDALISLGKTSVVGERALRKGRDEIDQLADTAQDSVSVASDLADFLRDIDDPDRAVGTDTRANEATGRKGETGYTGMEGLLNYVYYQTGAINQFDEIGHLLHFSIFEIGSGPCETFNAGPDLPAIDANGPPGSPGYTTTTDPVKSHRCVAVLGDSQPGINEDLNLPPYDPSVCPDGSTEPEICDPAGPSTAASEQPGSRSQGGIDQSGSSGSDPGGSAPPTGGGGGGGNLPGAGDLPDLPEPPSVGGGGLPGLDDLDDALGLKRRGAAPGGSGATDDLLGYLFGS